MTRGVGLLSMVMLTSAAASQPAVVTAVPVMTATTPTQQGGANRAISISGADGPFFVGTAELAGLEVYDASGKRIGSVPAGEAVSLDIRYDALPVAGKNAIQVTNILVGEVWGGSGQSNMEWSVERSVNPDKEIPAANFPEIRLFLIPKRLSAVPVGDVTARWVACTPESVRGFSAVLYFFGDL